MLWCHQLSETAVRHLQWTELAGAAFLLSAATVCHAQPQPPEKGQQPVVEAPASRIPAPRNDDIPALLEGRRGEFLRPEILPPAGQPNRSLSAPDPRCGQLSGSQRLATPGCQ
jgi:hypothetical protein